MSYYVITNGHDYAGRENFDGSGHWIPVGNKMRAYHFNTHLEAASVLKHNLPGKMKGKMNFRVDYIEEDEQIKEIVNNVLGELPPVIIKKDVDTTNVADTVKATENVDKKTREELIKNISNKKMPDKDVEDIYNMSVIIYNTLCGIDKRFEEDSAELSQIDKEIIDIEHYIEFGKFNAAEGYKAFKMLQNTLQRRRVIKNDMHAITIMRSGVTETESLSAKSLIRKTIDNKTYVPRVLTELFEEE